MTLFKSRAESFATVVDATIVDDENEEQANDKRIQIAATESSGLSYDVPTKHMETLSRTGSKVMNRLIIDNLKFQKGIMDSYFKHHFDFVRSSFISQANYIFMWKDIIEERKARFKRLSRTSGAEYTMYDDVLKVINEQVIVYINDIRLLADQFYTGRAHITLSSNNQTVDFSQYTDISTRCMHTIEKGRLKLFDGVKIKRIDERVKALNGYRNVLADKLSSMYNRKRSIMDYVMDSRFIALYVLKVGHLFGLVLAIFLSEKLFSELYMKKLYAENIDPPNILIMLAIFIALDVGIIMFIVTILFLFKYIFEKPADNFIISTHLIITFLKDYGAFMLLLSIMALIIGQILQKKKYFRYKTEGLRAIRAYKELIITIGAVLILIPYFTFLG
jgi:hypothetical protein